jgi:hypothetical protein
MPSSYFRSGFCKRSPTQVALQDLNYYESRRWVQMLNVAGTVLGRTVMSNIIGQRTEEYIWGKNALTMFVNIE